MRIKSERCYAGDGDHGFDIIHTTWSNIAFRDNGEIVRRVMLEHDLGIVIGSDVQTECYVSSLANDGYRHYGTMNGFSILILDEVQV